MMFLNKVSFYFQLKGFIFENNQLFRLIK